MENIEKPKQQIEVQEEIVPEVRKRKKREKIQKSS